MLQLNQNFRFKRLAVMPIFLLLSVIPSAAFSYQVEVYGGIYDAEHENIRRTSTTAVGVTYYLRPVSVEQHPYFEASFLERVSSIEASFGDTNYKWSTGVEVDTEAKVLNYTWMKKESPFRIGVGYALYEYSSNSAVLGPGDAKALLLAPGIYFGDSLFGFNYAEYKSELPSIQSATRKVGFWFKTVAERTKVYGSIVEINADSNTSPVESNVEFQIGGGYFPSRKSTIGLEFVLNDGEDRLSEGVTVEASAGLFLNDSVSLTLVYKSFDAIAGIDVKSTWLTVGGRF